MLLILPRTSFDDVNIGDEISPVMRSLGRMDLEIEIRNQDGGESKPGTAVTVLPLRDTEPVAGSFYAGAQFDGKAGS